MNFGLAGKVAVVTGGATGVGRAICLSLADEGTNVAILDTDVKGAEETARLVREKLRRATALQTDVADAGSVRVAFETVAADLGPVDVLVYCAATTGNRATIDQVGTEDWNNALAANVSGAVHCIKAVVPSMTGRKWGRLIFVSSRAGIDGAVEQSSFAAGPGGLNAL